MKNKGFTLIELLITIAIIGILAIVAVYNLSKYLEKQNKRCIQGEQYEICIDR